MAFPPHELSDDALHLLTTPRVLGTVCTVDPAGRPHAATVGYTYDHDQHVLRIVTMPISRKARNVVANGYAVFNMVDGMHWLQVQGPAVVRDDTASVDDAYRRFADRYGRVHEGDVLVSLEITVERCLGPVNGWGRIGFTGAPGHT